MKKNIIEHKMDTYFWNLRSEKIFENYAYINNFYTLEQANAIINAGLDSRFSNMSMARVGIDNDTKVEINPDIRRGTVSWIKSSEPDNGWIFRTLTDAVLEINEKFFNYDLKGIESLQFSIYDSEDKDFYTKHIDTMRISQFESMRKLSFSVQLSDPESYDGGELLLHFSENPVVLPKTLGSIYFFPSFTLHEVKPVTKGTRYSLVGWVVGPRFK